MPFSRTNPFVQHLRQRCELEESELPRPGELSSVGNTIGALALRLGVLTVSQLEEILVVQEEQEEGKKFGELAVELGFLTEEQVDQLLAIQEMNRCLELGEQLVLAGRLELPELLHELHVFIGQKQRSGCAVGR
jgi:hypothetical protein